MVSKTTVNNKVSVLFTEYEYTLEMIAGYENLTQDVDHSERHVKVEIWV